MREVSMREVSMREVEQRDDVEVDLVRKPLSEFAEESLARGRIEDAIGGWVDR